MPGNFRKQISLLIIVLLSSNSTAFALGAPSGCNGSTGYRYVTKILMTPTEAQQARDAFCAGAPDGKGGLSRGAPTSFICGPAGWGAYYCHYNNKDGNFFLYPNNSTCQNTIDSDSDGICDENDNCPNTPNLDQADCDGDGVGDACTTQGTCAPIPCSPLIDGDGDGSNQCEDCNDNDDTVAIGCRSDEQLGCPADQGGQGK